MKTFLIAGGDMRQTYLADMLSKDYKVYTIGFDKNIIKSNGITLFDGIAQCNVRVDYIVLPLPCSTDGVFLNAPFCRKSIPIDSLTTIAKEDCIVFGGNVSKDIERVFTDRGLKVFDFAKREEFNIYNAVATSEGAIQITLEELPETISNQKVLILGFGRIAKVLAYSLKCLNANVTISARKYSDLAWADIMGYGSIHLSNLEDHLASYKIIYNTIPILVLDKSRLNTLNKDTIIIDLASKPGGVDFQSAYSLDLKTIWALSLPGKTSPVSAGRYIGIAIKNILKDLQV